MAFRTWPSPLSTLLCLLSIVFDFFFIEYSSSNTAMHRKYVYVCATDGVFSKEIERQTERERGRVYVKDGTVFLPSIPAFLSIDNPQGPSPAYVAADSLL